MSRRVWKIVCSPCFTLLFFLDLNIASIYLYLTFNTRNIDRLCTSINSLHLLINSWGWVHNFLCVVSLSGKVLNFAITLFSLIKQLTSLNMGLIYYIYLVFHNNFSSIHIKTLILRLVSSLLKITLRSKIFGATALWSQVFCASSLGFSVAIYLNSFAFLRNWGNLTYRSISSIYWKSFAWPSLFLEFTMPLINTIIVLSIRVWLKCSSPSLC